MIPIKKCGAADLSEAPRCDYGLAVNQIHSGCGDFAAFTNVWRIGHRFQIDLGIGVERALAFERGIRRDEFAVTVGMEARTCWDQLTDDHVLFQAVQTVFLALDGRTSQHLDGVLEARSREEAICIERGLGHAEQYRDTCGRLFAVINELVIDVKQHQAINQLAGQQFAVTALGDLNLREHLADDHLEVLVSDVHALVTIHILYFGQQIQLAGFRALDAQDTVWVLRTFGQLLTSLDLSAIESLRRQAGTGRDFILVLFFVLLADIKCMTFQVNRAAHLG